MLATTANAEYSSRLWDMILSIVNINEQTTLHYSYTVNAMNDYI